MLVIYVLNSEVDTHHKISSKSTWNVIKPMFGNIIPLIVVNPHFSTYRDDLAYKISEMLMAYH